MMSTRTVNLDIYSLSLLTAKEDIFNPRSSTDWALFVYDGVSNKLKLADSGAGGVAELSSKFNISKPQYGLCRIGGPDSTSPKTAMIIWVGQNVDDYRRTECANHIPAIKNFFKEAHVFLKAEKPEEVTEERVRAELTKAHTNASTQWLRRSSRSMDREELVGTNYRKTNAAMEMRLLNRDSFWARAEREEEERKEEDRKKATEERRRLERERATKERQDAEERDRKMNEKLKMIEEQRRKAAEQEAEQGKKEKLKWELQQREHEEEMRARLKRSESIEKAAEAAALVSQRTMNPREFFRQLSSSSSLSPTSPSRTGKPFRRYQRSLTDTAFIFAKAEESAASSPRSSPLVSPFSRAPPSPFNRAASPPTSPVFHTTASPQRTPLSPPLSPLSPLRSAPPTSALPSIPPANLQMKGRAQSPTGPSAPPASPTLLASSVEGAPGSPPNVSEHNSFSFEGSLSPPASRASLPEQPLSAAELVSEISYKVQTVLVEEDEEEEEDDIKEKEESQPTPESEPQADPEEPEEAEAQTQQQVEAVEDEEEVKEDGEDEPQTHTEPEETASVEEQHQTDEEDEGVQGDMKTEDVHETHAAVQEEEEEEVMEEAESVPETPEEPQQQVEEKPEEMVTEEEPDQNDLSPAEPALLIQQKDILITDPVSEVSQEIKCVTTDLSLDVITNGNTQEHNGTDHSLSPSDPELDSPELAVYCTVEDDEEEDICIQKYIKISENGEEVLMEPQVCVRALYDYQAEDESELSFELGDIIKDVEAVDKGWWRGWSQDGRQGLFPANYVETISPQ